MNKMEESMKPKTTFGDTLKFTPYAWSKLLWMRDRGPTEVAGYGVTGTENPLLVTDFILIKQECTAVTFDLDPEDGVEYAEKMTDRGIPPWACQNILIHTHPGDSPSPSGVDEINFAKAFTHPHWAIMFIIAEGGKCSCRLKINVGPGITKELNVSVDWSKPFEGADFEQWDVEYMSKVEELTFSYNTPATQVAGNMSSKLLGKYDSVSEFNNIQDPLWYAEDADEWLKLSELENDIINDDIDFECHWDINGEVAFWDTEESLWYTYDPIEQQWYKEEIGRNENNTKMNAIVRPDKEWTDKVVEWACMFQDERQAALEV